MPFQAYTVESVSKRKPRCFFCPGITAFVAGIWIGVVFSLYGMHLSGIGASVHRGIVKESSVPYAEGRAFRKMKMK